MGGTPLSELNIVTKYIQQNLAARTVNVAKWFVGDYMTSFRHARFFYNYRA